MTLTMHDVMADPMFARTDPTIEAGEAGMDRTIRWAYTNERYDIASFLSGGELVIIEGSALLGHMGDDEVIRYVDTLVDAGVAGLAIELVEGVRTVPKAMIARADERGLPVIGMHRRMPFVDLCQSINTSIVKDQLLVQVRTDTLATTMRTRLATARSAQDVAKILNEIFGESVAIFDSDGLVIAHCGPSIRPADTDHPAERTLVLDVRKNGGPLASIEITQRNRLADGRIADRVDEVIKQVLPAFVQTQPRNAMLAHVLQGPTNGYRAGEQEINDAATMLQAIGLSDVKHLIPFAIGMDSVSSSIDAVSRCLSGDEEEDASDEDTIADVLEGNMLFGLYAAADGSDDKGPGSGLDTGTNPGSASDANPGPAQGGGTGKAGNRGDAVMRLKRQLADVAVLPGTWCIYGRTVPSVGMLLDECGLLQFAAHDAAGLPGTGTVTNLLTAAPQRLLGIGHTRDAAGALQSLMLGDALPNQESLIRTLEACFNAGGNISKACELLRIHRQTLYNRLAKITELTGISKEDSVAWPLLLCAAKLKVAELQATDLAIVAGPTTDAHASVKVPSKPPARINQHASPTLNN